MKLNFLLAFIALVVVVTTIGCGTAPRPTAVPTLAPQIITVVITATPPPTADTPVPTFAPTGTLTTTSAITRSATANAQARATNTTAPVRAASSTARPNTATPAKVGTAAPTKIPFISKYSQPTLRLIGPIDAQRDVRNYGGDTLQLEWQSIGPLGTNECYLIRVDTKSNADQSVGGDTFLFCDNGTKGTQAPTAQTVQFTLNKPNASPGPTYSGISPPGGGDVTVSWTVTIASDEGPGTSVDAYYWSDASRRKFTLLSPPSSVGYATLRGAPTGR